MNEILKDTVYMVLILGGTVASIAICAGIITLTARVIQKAIGCVLHPDAGQEEKLSTALAVMFAVTAVILICALAYIAMVAVFPSADVFDLMISGTEYLDTVAHPYFSMLLFLDGFIMTVCIFLHEYDEHGEMRVR